jgi:CRISPR-associated protein Csa3
MKILFNENPYKYSSIGNLKGENMNVLISTLYSFEPVILAATKLGIDKLILIIDNKLNEKQKESFELVKNSLGKVVEVKQVKTELYDIVKVAEEAIKAIDYESDKNIIYVNITGARKTQSLGLLFAAYSRIEKIKQIIYIIEETKQMISLPKLNFNLNNSQKLILEYIYNKELTSLSELSNKIKISRGMLYRVIKELKDLGLIYEDEGFKLSDAGRIAVL